MKRQQNLKTRIKKIKSILNPRNFFASSNSADAWKDILGATLPPPQEYKQKEIINYQKKNNLIYMIETGTFLGDTLFTSYPFFDKLISIELSKALYDRANERFKDFKKIKLLNGDSGELMSGLLEEINVPTLFWLDGHYSEGITAKGVLNTPILKELEAILNHSIDDHIILIDDARCFIGEEDYPTLFDLKEYVLKRNPKMGIAVKHDIIRIGKRI